MGKVAIDLSSVTTVGLDLAKHVFFVHAVDAKGEVVVAREVRRRDLHSFFASLPACRVGVEACSSAHHWGREAHPKCAMCSCFDSTVRKEDRTLPDQVIKPILPLAAQGPSTAGTCGGGARPSPRPRTRSFPPSMRRDLRCPPVKGRPARTGCAQRSAQA